MYRPKRILTAALCSALPVALAHAGPLDPPQGPVSSTYKTLAEVEPRIPIGPETTPGDQLSHFRIREPGSYYLTGDIVGQDRYGIMISADAVTIDLMGFEVNGGGSSYGGIFVYDDQGDLENITVCNGTVRSWGMDGVNLGHASGARVRDVQSSFNDGDGIAAGGHAVVTGCVATNNTGWGIDAGYASVVSGCVAAQNGQGMRGASAVVFEGCVASENDFYGFNVGNASVISGCTALQNENAGIVLQTSSIARGNVSSYNKVGVLATGDSNRIEGNHCNANELGFHVLSARNLIVSNIASDNTLNWDVLDQNACFVVPAKLSGAIRGDGGGVPPASSEPGANVSFSR